MSTIKRTEFSALRFCVLLCLFFVVFNGLSDGLRGQGVPVEKGGVTSYGELQELASAISKRAYEPQPEVPQVLKELTYDQFRFIGFTDGKEVWAETLLPFRVGFYHKGYVAVDDVSIDVIRDGQDFSIPFSRNYFHYLAWAHDLKLPDDVGFAGFRIKTVFPDEIEMQEIFTFVGASYFRARAKNTILGTSTRGLAIDCGLPKPEEFPVFRKYWIVKPKMGDTSLHVLGLLESQSVTGAYDFVLSAGTDATTIDVKETLYFRSVPEKVGIAPMSSMWLWGDGLAGPQGDHRPEVHDSDGLQIQDANGNWLWRALGQQGYPSIVHLAYPAVKGFGLIQRDVNKEHYLDDEALYHMRPSVWIEPLSDWGPGAIELLELDAPHEGIDNIAAWWVPDQKVEVGKPIELSYRLSYFLGDRADHELAKAVGHRIVRNEGKMQLEVDFRGPSLMHRGENFVPEVEVSSIRGAVISSSSRASIPGDVTTKLEIEPTGEGPVELQVKLKDGAQVLTETWSYLCPLTAPKVELPPWKKKDEEKK